MTQARPESVLTCHYAETARCTSCTLLGTPYAEQVEDKSSLLATTLAAHVPTEAWLPPVTSPDRRFRNKAKLAVGGTLAAPTLGITSSNGHGVDLRECGIHTEAIWAVVPDLAGFVTHARLTPYDVAARRGELKFIIVTAAPGGELMLRFVLRSREALPALRGALPDLLARLPQVVSVSANLHPEHKAVLEGPEEIQLYGPEDFSLPVADRTLLLRHRSFFQTNTAVAEALYRQASEWAAMVGADAVLDLYCGVGGFALNLVRPGRTVHGIEMEADAVAAARRAAGLLPSSAGRASFTVGDATGALDPDSGYDFVVVNPPRRGLGADLCERIETARPRHVLYSSCNPETLETDLTRLASYRVRHARLFDMFPQTRHCEVAVLLHRT